MYYLCKFSDSWSVLDGKSNTSRQLKADEIESLKSIFPQLFGNNNKVLSAIKVESINPNKLLQLSLPEKATIVAANSAK
jgi:hypothetical protein